MRHSLFWDYDNLTNGWCFLWQTKSGNNKAFTQQVNYSTGIFDDKITVEARPNSLYMWLGARL
jgi:hypothetical protein